MLQVIIRAVLALVLAGLISWVTGDTRRTLLVYFLLTLTAVALLLWLTYYPYKYKSRPVDLLSLSAREITALLENGTLSSVRLVREYHTRIDVYKQLGLGLELTPWHRVIDKAHELDWKRRNGIKHSALHGVPLVIRGNKAADTTLGMVTKAGAFTLRHTSATYNAFILGKAHQAGLIIVRNENNDGFHDNELHPGWSELSSGKTLDDSHGVFTKSSLDIAALLTTMGALDWDDDSVPATALDVKWDNFRIGVADNGRFWSSPPEGFLVVGCREDIEEEEIFAEGLQAIEEMKRRGATIVDNAEIRCGALSLGHMQKLMTRMMRADMQEGIPRYVKSLPRVQVESFEDLVCFDREKHLNWSSRVVNYDEYHEAMQESRKIAIDDGINETLERYNLDALVFPAWTDMSRRDAWGQAPTATVPLSGYRRGKPYGLGFIARRFDDEKLVQIMDLCEKTFPPRLVPTRERRKVEFCLTSRR